MSACDSVENVVKEEITDTEAPENIVEQESPTVRSLELNVINIEPDIKGNESYYIVYVTFSTDREASTIVSYDGREQRTALGFRHSAVFISNRKDAVYSIKMINESCAADAPHENILIEGVLNNEESGAMFKYTGNILSRTDELVPIMEDIYYNLYAYRDDISISIFVKTNEEIFAKSTIFTFEENTADELFASLKTKYEIVRGSLENMWPLMSESERQLSFVVNVVNRLWHFGNYRYPVESGCVQVNETIAADEADSVYEYAADGTPFYRKKVIGMRDYLLSEIGCCIDQAFMTKVLLDKAGFETRRLITSGHWLTEALVDGNWYLIDSTTSVIVRSSAENISKNAERDVYLFFSPYMDSDDLKYYSSRIYPDFVRYTIGIGIETILDKIDYLYGYSNGEMEKMNGN